MKWFHITARSGAGKIAIYDEIGSHGISGSAFGAALNALGKVSEIDLSINSPGGSVFDGILIYNLLRRHTAKVRVTIDGVAASIASVIAMAGNEIIMPENAFMMLHNPAGAAVGTADDMRDLAEALDKIAASMVGIYATRTGLSHEEVGAMMAVETWLDASEAMSLGFADKVERPVKAAAHFDLTSRFGRVPAQAKAPSQLQPLQTSAPEILHRVVAPVTPVDEMEAKYRAFLQSHPLAAEYIVAAYHRAGNNSSGEFNAAFKYVWDAAQKGERRPDLMPGTAEAKANAWKLDWRPIRAVR